MTVRPIIIALASIMPFAVSATSTLRANQLGYLTDDIKVAVYMGDNDPAKMSFTLTGPDKRAIKPDSVVVTEAWAPAAHSARIYFSSVTVPGQYTLTAKDSRGRKAESTELYIGDDAYSRHNVHELPLVYLRQQRCGYNPTHDALCHQNDGILVLSGADDGKHVDVTGGWHDASDYLQYLTTSANTVYQMLFAYSQTPEVWGDEYDAMGRKGANGVPDILDEARWGLDWMMKMNPADTLFLNQIADDRDHRFVGTPYTDNVDYGWGEGGARPVYPCLGKPSGLSKYRNESSGLASSVGKFASSFGLGAEVFATIDPTFASELERRSAVAFDKAAANPGACQTCSTVSPYYYEEDNWTDDMELAAMARYRATGDPAYLKRAVDYGRMEPVTPWMGADSAHHYQWYPFINLGHYELAKSADKRISGEFLRNMRSGLDRVGERGNANAFHVGIPFIWCSNNLAAALITQAMLYRDLTGDQSYRELETSMRDWLFGVNPWGQTMIILPKSVTPNSPEDPHSAMTDLTVKGKPGRDALIGGLVDGPVYANIYNSLWGVRLRRNDAFADFQNPVVVYHDDYADYSTNEPTMDGTASLTYLLSRLSAKGLNK